MSPANFLRLFSACLVILLAFHLRAASPSISVIAEQAAYPDLVLGPISFAVGDAETPATQLSLRVASTNTVLVPTNAIQFGGSGSNRTLTIGPTPGQRGTSRITVTVIDEAANESSTSFLLRVEEFTAIEVTALTWYMRNSTWVDYDNDGDLDLCAPITYTSPYVTKFFRNDSGAFVEAQSVPVLNLIDPAPAFGDFDNDGDLDLVLSGYQYPEPVMLLYRNEGISGFVLLTNLAGLVNGRAEWADGDNDGALDLLIGGSLGNGFPYVTKIFRNNRDGTFSDLHAALPGAGINAVVDWGDYDNDGDLDVLTAGTHAAAVVRNIGRGKFTSSGVPLPLVQSAAAQWGDLDGDGWLDFVLAGDTNRASGYTTEFARIFRNQQDGSFSNINATLAGIDTGSVAWGDYDSDGQLDLLIAGSVSSYYLDAATRIYRNEAGVLSLSISNLPLATYPWEWGDYDSDGDLDLLQDGTVYRNNLQRSNASPAAPLNLAATTLANYDVLLTWAPAVDAETTNATALNYNLRIGRTPGGSEVMSAQSLPDGTRLLPKRGKVNSTSWRLVDLPHGTYYWTVQAIDPGFRGSPFAAESTFAISNSPPIVSWIADQAALPGQTPSPVTFTTEDAESPANALVITATSSNTNLVRDADFAIGGAGTNRTLTFSAQPLPRGSSEITVTVTDADGRVTTRNFVFNLEEFSSVPVPALFSSLQITRPGDFTSDGWLDAAFGGGLYHREGGNFALTGGFGSGTWGDYNNDGWLDSFAGDKVYVNVGGGFTNSLIIRPPFASGNAIAWADTDSDGDLDLFLSGLYSTGSSAGKVLRNNGGVFSVTNIGALGGAGPVAWADFDNDGDMDVMAAAGFPSDVPRLYRNDGNHRFTLVTCISLDFYWARALTWGDFNNDGRPDLLVTGDPSNNSTDHDYVTRIYRNDGPGPTNNVWLFTDIQANLPALYGSFPTQGVGDFDNDGWLDLLLAQEGIETNLFRIFRNNGNQTFTDIGADLYGASAFGDVDNDGDLDVLFGARKVWFRNNTVRTNAVPATPVSLVSTQMRTGVRLSWTPGADQNQGGGLTYNLRVGRSPGAIDVMSPHSDLATGKRRLPQMGNAGSMGFWHLTNLAVGTYYWSVQCVDHSYAGSAWAPERTFVIPEQPPVVLTREATDISYSGATLTGEVLPNGFATAFRFEYGLDTSYGSVTPWLNLANGTNFSAAAWPVSGLLASTLYHFRILATNVNGITYGDDASFFTRGFSEVNVNIPLTGGIGASWGDYDNDGRLDLAAISSEGTFIYRNLGNNQFQAGTPLPGGPQGAVRWGDLDNDGDLDLLVCGVSTASRSTRVYRNEGNGTFTDLLVNLIASVDGAWLDFNNDGRLDVVVVSPTQARLYANRGNGSFSGITIGPYVTGDAVSIGDYDNDGFADLLLNGGDDYGAAQIFRNNRDGTFSALAPLARVHNGAADWGDFDNDGRLDVLLTGFENGFSYSAQTLVYHNRGGGTFSAIATGLPASYGGFAGWGDYNADGVLDLLLTGSFHGVAALPRVFRGDGLGAFRDIGVGLSANASSAGWADYDNDGDLDYWAWWPPRIHQNLNLYSNTPPLPPVNLSATILSSNDVLLTWNMAYDEETADERGLSYSLRVGSTSGGFDVVAPPSDLATGFRRLPQLGNVKSNAWVLRGVPRGTFYWSVQAVDGGFAGSVFAAEQSFSITNDRPFISPIPDTAVAPGQTPAVISFTVSDDSTLPHELLLTVRSSNTSFLSNAGVLISNTGTNRVLSLTPNTTNSGVTTITLTAIDAGGLVATRSFRFAVEAFTSLPVTLPNGNDVSISWGDYDNDGDLDLAFAHSDYANAGLKLYRNDGASTFTDVDAGFVQNASGAVQWLDVNNDGWLDLFVFGGANGGTFLNQTNGTFVHTSGFTGPGSFQLTPGDFDNDGRTDVLVTGGNGGLSRVLFNRHGGLSTENMASSLGAGSPAVGDFDRDGDLDVWLGGDYSRVLLNDGTGDFEPGPSFPLGGTAAAADFDGDGNVDVALSSGTGSFYLYRNEGDTTFSLMSSNLGGVGRGTMTAADFNNDGRVDLLMSGCFGYCSGDQGFTLRVLRNEGGWNFSTIYSQSQSTPALWADFDGDGDLDITHGGFSGLLRNNFNAPHPAPPGPTALTATFADDGVILSWMRPTNSATYALRIGSTPGGIDVLAPGSSAAGQRRIAGPGPAVDRWKLHTPIAVGTYSWSVQSIDSGWAGSPFAPEAMFHVPNFRPTAWASDLFINEDTPTWNWLYVSDFNGDVLTIVIVSGPTNGTVTLGSNWAIYHPNTNYFGTDSFVFEARDGMTNSEPELVRIQINNVPDVSATRLSVASAGGQWQLDVQGEPYQRYAIDVSDDLLSWTQTTALRASVNGGVVFAIAPDERPHRFYRARAIP